MTGYQRLAKAVFYGPAHRHSEHCQQIDAIVAEIMRGSTMRQIAREFDYADGKTASVAINRMLRAHGIHIDRTPRVVST